MKAASLALAWAFALTGIALIGLTLAFVSGDLSLRTVAEQITLNMARSYKAAALWCSGAGCRLVFALAVSGCAACASHSRRPPAPTARSTVALATLVTFALAWTALGDPPFARLAFLPTEGRGLAAPLQIPTLLAATPALLLGYAILTVAGALAADREQRHRASRWLLASWMCQTLALSLRALVLEQFLVPGWPGRVSVVIAISIWFTTAMLLAVPRVRRQWWPAENPARRMLAGAFSAAVVLTTVSGAARLGRTTHVLTLGQGESATVNDSFGRAWTFAQQGVSPFRTGDNEVLAVTLEGVRGSRRELLVTQRSQFLDSRSEEVGPPVVRSARASGLMQDVSVGLMRLLPNDSAQLRIEFTPVGAWLWAGCALLIMAGAAGFTTALWRPT